MSKTPAFLLYSKDWLQGTAEMTAIEKGVFIDLLCHQHQTGSLPSDPSRLARLSCMSLDEFAPIWESLQHKFTTINETNASAIAIANGTANASAIAGRIVNMKLNDVISETKEKAKQNRVISIWSHLLKNCSLSKKDIDKIRKQFKVKDFLKYDEHELSERMSEWFCERIKNVEDADGHVDVNVDVDVDVNEDRKGGVGERKDELPALYRNIPVFVPAGWPVEEFTARWNAHRIYKLKQHAFKWKDEYSEKKSIMQFFNEVGSDGFKFAMDCIDFCEGKTWKGIFVNSYRRELRSHDKQQQKKHNDFDKTHVPV